jgi:hypothetical protein
MAPLWSAGTTKTFTRLPNVRIPGSVASALPPWFVAGGSRRDIEGCYHDGRTPGDHLGVLAREAQTADVTADGRALSMSTEG